MAWGCEGEMLPRGMLIGMGSGMGSGDWNGDCHKDYSAEMDNKLACGSLCAGIGYEMARGNDRDIGGKLPEPSTFTARPEARRWLWKW